MRRIIAAIITALALCGGGYYVVDTIQRLAIAEQANNELASTVAQLDMQRDANERAAAIYAERAYHYQQESINSRTELASLKGKHNEAARYLATLTPDSVAGWLFLRSHCEAGAGCDYAAILAAAGYASTTTTTEEVYQWCSDTAAALTRCNKDKQQAREYVAQHAAIVAGPP